MNKREFTLGISPCPNDTFIFDALLHNKLAECPFTLKVVYHDVQTLNEMAREGKLDLLKISYGNLLHAFPQYRLLKSGGAMGFGCGPLLLNNSGAAFDAAVATMLPGRATTAAALYNFWLTESGYAQSPVEYHFFDALYQKLLNKEPRQGVVIHESRFTFENDGLHLIQDLGAFWEQVTNLPIPLGGIVIRKDLVDEAPMVDTWIKESIVHARLHNTDALVFIKDKAQIADESVVCQHIETYVNTFSDAIGDEGFEAIEKLLSLLEPNTHPRLKDILAY